ADPRAAAGPRRPGARAGPRPGGRGGERVGQGRAPGGAQVPPDPGAAGGHADRRGRPALRPEPARGGRRERHRGGAGVPARLQVARPGLATEHGPGGRAGDGGSEKLEGRNEKRENGTRPVSHFSLLTSHFFSIGGMTTWQGRLASTSGPPTRSSRSSRAASRRWCRTRRASG